MTSWAHAGTQLRDALGDLRPVAVSYLDAPPPGVEKFSGTVPSGCTFWRLAAEGRAFYTVPSDFYNCPIGSYTHAIDLPAERAGELEQVLGLMVGAGYLKMEEVPSIPRLPRAPAITYFAPLDAAVVAPDVVIVSGKPGALMRLQEAAIRAGAVAPLPLLGRPTCMAPSRGHRARHGDEQRLHRQPRLHQSRRRRVVRDDSGCAPRRRRRGGGHDRVGE